MLKRAYDAEYCLIPAVECTIGSAILRSLRDYCVGAAKLWPRGRHKDVALLSIRMLYRLLTVSF
jgi:hypothetical protein